MSRLGNSRRIAFLNGGGDLNSIAAQNGEDLVGILRLGNAGTRTDAGGIVPGDIGDDVRHDPGRRGRQGQPAALDAGERLAHLVHLMDGRPRPEESLRHTPACPPG